MGAYAAFIKVCPVLARIFALAGVGLALLAIGFWWGDGSSTNAAWAQANARWETQVTSALKRAQYAEEALAEARMDAGHLADRVRRLEWTVDLYHEQLDQALAERDRWKAAGGW